MLKNLMYYGAGFIFSLGLGLGGMTLPSNIIGFLDFTGQWKPALLFVMATAVVVYGIAFRFILRKPKPVFAPKFSVPISQEITPQLVIGAGLFGVGWGMTGYCPGPAIMSLVTGSMDVFIFMVAMISGMYLHRLTTMVRSPARA